MLKTIELKTYFKLYYFNFSRTPAQTHENSILENDSENSLMTENDSIRLLVSFVLLFLKNVIPN